MKKLYKTTYLIWTPVILMLIFMASCNEERIAGVESEIGTLNGKVVEKGTNIPLANAKIITNPTSNTVFTDSTGDYTIEEIDAGDYTVIASKDDYIEQSQPATIESDETTQVVFELEPEEMINFPPDAPELINPGDNELLSSIEVIFRWSGSDPEDDELTYTLELRNDENNDVLVFNDIQTDSLVYSELMMGVKYFWQVAANDGVNEVSTLSPVGSFRVDDPPVENRFLFTRTINGNNVIFSADEAGNEFQLTPSDVNSYRPRRSVTANRIAFFRNDGADLNIYSMDRDGTNVRQVTLTVNPQGFNLNEINFAWPLNSDRIYYPQLDKLYSIRENGQGLELVYQTPDGSLISEVDVSENADIIVLKTNNLDGYNVRVFAIDFDGNVLHTILENVPGAVSGLSLSVTNNSVVYGYDVSGFEDANYRRLNTRIFAYDLAEDTTIDVSGDKPGGTNDFDCVYSPNEAEIIFTNTSNDGLSQRDIFSLSFEIVDDELVVNRTQLFSNAFMPDWE